MLYLAHEEQKLVLICAYVVLCMDNIALIKSFKKICWAWDTGVIFSEKGTGFHVIQSMDNPNDEGYGLQEVQRTHYKVYLQTETTK